MSNLRVLVFGATGNVGGAATRELLRRGWHVRAVTRNPDSEKALAIANLGAEVVRGDMDDRVSLEMAFDGMQRVFSIQNPFLSGTEGEVRQGKLVADVALSAGVEHLVYSSAGTGEPGTGVPHFETKVEIESYMRELDLPLTILHPVPFMELLILKEFYPALGAWGAEPKALGWDTPIPWVAVHDIGIAIANVFEARDTWVGCETPVFSDVKTLAECQNVFVKVDGTKPFRLPLPLWLFQKMAGIELILMWKWMAAWIAESGSQGLEASAKQSRKVCPTPLSLEDWLRMMRAQQDEK